MSTTTETHQWMGEFFMTGSCVVES